MSWGDVQCTPTLQMVGGYVAGIPACCLVRAVMERQSLCRRWCGWVR